MKKFGNTYIFIYVTALVLVIAVVLTLVTTLLRPRRDFNRQAEKCQQILQAAGYQDLDRQKSVELFAKVAEKDSSDSLEQYDIVCADGSNGKAVRLDGKGLWGAIWGYVVLSEDGTTIKGITLDHKSETPGLGAKITDNSFLNSFKGKKLYDKNGKLVSVRVLKPGTSPEVATDNRVDAISGATITSRGVDAMMKTMAH